MHVPNYLGPKTLSNDTTSIQLLAGLEGEFPGRDWTWELYTSHGSSRSQVQTGGTTRLEGFRWMVNQPNYAKGLQYTGNPQGAGFGAGTVYCTSGLPIFYGVNGWTEAAFPFVNPTEGVPTQDCMDTMVAQCERQRRDDAERHRVQPAGPRVRHVGRRGAVCSRRVAPGEHLRVHPRHARSALRDPRQRGRNLPREPVVGFHRGIRYLRRVPPAAGDRQTRASKT